MAGEYRHPNMVRKPQTQIEPAEFGRPANGPIVELLGDPHGLPLTDQPVWQSSGGPTRGHAARSFPHSFEASVPDESDSLVRIHLLGAFALYADRNSEPLGTLGASVQLFQDRVPTFRQDLLNGRHYADALDLTPSTRLVGDGTSTETVGMAMLGDQTVRIDLLTIDIPAGTIANCLRFKDLGSPASFAVLDVFLESEVKEGCPFRTRPGGVALAEVGAIVRVGDRLRFNKAVTQLEQSLMSAEDLDEARGQALTFLAVVIAGSLERGGGREMHRAQLEAARELDQLASLAGIWEATRARIDSLSGMLFQEAQGPSGHLIDRALSIVERNYAKEISDATIADQLGLSTSHFRYLFRQATGQPFHKYLVALRLEKARRLLIEGEMPIGDVARSVGFTGLSHFSRAFAQRFNVSPTSVRRSAT